MPNNVHTSEHESNTITSTYNLVQNSRDVSYLLDLSAEVSLKIMTNLIGADWAGHFIRQTNYEEKMVNLMVVMKYTKLWKTIDPEADLRPLKNVAGIGTHYVRSVKYGGELVARLTFNSTERLSDETLRLRGDVKLPLEKVLDGEVVAALEKLSENSDNFTNLRILYYCSAVSEDPLPTTVDDLIRQITAFPSKMAQIDHGIPIEYELLPVSTIDPQVPSPIPQGIQLEDLLDRFDDLRGASQLAKKYLSIAPQTPADDFVKFINEVRKVKRAMKKGILSLYREEQVRLLNESIQAYDEALSGEANFVGKFVIKWRSLNGGKKKKILLKITVLCGRNIKRHDLDGQSDPYVKLIQTSANGKSTKTRTEAKKNTENPKWNAVFHYILDPNVEHTLEIQLVDEDPLVDDLLGTKTFKLRGLTIGTKVKETFKFGRDQRSEVDMEFFTKHIGVAGELPSDE